MKLDWTHVAAAVAGAVVVGAAAPAVLAVTGVAALGSALGITVGSVALPAIGGYLGYKAVPAPKV